MSIDINYMIVYTQGGDFGVYAQRRFFMYVF